MNDIELFFENVKDCNLNNFKANLDIAISGIENRSNYIKKLLELFRDEQRKNRKYLAYLNKIDTDTNYANDLRLKIRTDNDIINYLKYKLLNCNKTKKDITNIDRTFFSDDVVLLANIIIKQNDILTYLENKFISIDKIEKVIKYLKIKLKKTSKNKEKINQISIYKRKLINEMKKHKCSCINDDKLSLLLQQFEIVEDKTKVLSNIINLYKETIEREIEQYKMLYDEENITQFREKSNIDTSALKEFYFNINNLKEEYDYYVNLLKKIKCSDKMNNKFTSEIELSSIQKLINNKLLNNEHIDMDSYNIKDILYAYGYYIKYDGIIDNLMYDYANELIAELGYHKINNEEILVGISYICDCLKSRLLTISKDDKQKRKILNNIKKEFSFYIRDLKKADSLKDDNSLFEVVDCFLKNENVFMYLKEIVNEIPKIVNSRQTIIDNEGNKTTQHIVLYIVDKFIENYKIMLSDKNNNYINKDYLKEVYFLFTSSIYLNLTDDEKNIINKKLLSFMNYANKNITSPLRRNAIKMDLREMYTDKIYYNKYRRRENILKNASYYKTEYILNTFSLNLKNSLLDKDRVDLTDDDCITLNDDFCCYSISKYYDKTVLKISVIDLYKSLSIYPIFCDYIFNNTILDENVDDIILNNITMIEDFIYPTITYEIVFDKYGNYKNINGDFISFNIYNSKVKIKKSYVDNDLLSDKDDQLIKKFVNLFRVIGTRNNYQFNSLFSIADINSYFEKILNEGVIKFVKDNNIPFIYTGISEYTNDELSYLRNEMKTLMSKVNENDFNTIYNIIDKNRDLFHYSTIPFNGEYQLFIKNPVNYPGILIQSIIYEFIINNRDKNDKEYEKKVSMYREKINEIVFSFNWYNNYLDKNDLKSNKGHLQNIKKKNELFGS